MPAVCTWNLRWTAISACLEAVEPARQWRLGWFCHMLAALITSLPSMPLLPRWQFMTDQGKALVTRSVISVGVLLLAALVLRSLIPWVVLGLIIWLVWQVLARR